MFPIRHWIEKEFQVPVSRAETSRTIRDQVPMACSPQNPLVEKVQSMGFREFLRIHIVRQRYHDLVLQFRTKGTAA